MTPQEAVQHFAQEFVSRFGCNAEGCTEQEKTHEALKVLGEAVGLGPLACPGPYCEKEEPEAP